VRVRRAPRVRALVLGSLLSAMVLLGGCDSDEPPTSGPTPTPSSTTSSTSPSPPATPTPTPSETSTIPAAARKNTPEGAEAFVRYFFKQYNDAWTGPEVGLISRLSDSECEFCARAESTSETLESRGDRYESAPVNVAGTQPLAGAPDPEAYVFVELVQNRSRVIARDGSVVHTDPQRAIPSNVAVKWVGDRWIVMAVEVAGQ
jgi:hypothetical protein